MPVLDGEYINIGSMMLEAKVRLLLRRVCGCHDSQI